MSSFEDSDTNISLESSEADSILCLEEEEELAPDINREVNDFRPPHPCPLSSTDMNMNQLERDRRLRLARSPLYVDLDPESNEHESDNTRNVSQENETQQRSVPSTVTTADIPSVEMELGSTASHSSDSIEQPSSSSDNRLRFENPHPSVSSPDTLMDDSDLLQVDPRRPVRSLSPFPNSESMRMGLLGYVPGDSSISSTASSVSDRSESPVTDLSRPSTPTTELEDPQRPDANSSIVSEVDDNSICVICTEMLTSTGEHRIVCLKCGHIFGRSCLFHWLTKVCAYKYRRCPTCNELANIKDIRTLYLPRVVPLDPMERDTLIKEKQALVVQKNKLEIELSKYKLREDLMIKNHHKILARIQKELTETKNQLYQIGQGENVAKPVEATNYERINPYVNLLHTIELSKDGGCRILAFNPTLKELAVSQPFDNNLFPGFGVRVLNSVDYRPKVFTYLHRKMIRDLAFHPDEHNLLLSVSLDHSAKLVDLSSNTIVHSFKGCDPLWSCCWDETNPHHFMVGSQQGRVVHYDRRMTDSAVNQYFKEDDKCAVVSLAAVPSAAGTPFPQGGFFVCKLTGLHGYVRHGTSYSMHNIELDGPFTSMRYDSLSQNLITSARPSSKYPFVRINANSVDYDETGNITVPLIHRFNCGITSSGTLSRVASLPMASDSLIIGHSINRKCLNLWSLKSGSPIGTVPVTDIVSDVTNMVSGTNDKRLFASLSPKSVYIYEVAQKA